MSTIGDQSTSVFKEVPESVEHITSTWCQAALRQSGIISGVATVSNVTVKRLKNEETGTLDGGGMTAAKIFRIFLTYDGEADGSEPATIVAKAVLSGDNMLKFNVFFRFMIRTMYKRNAEEELWRTDIKFYREALPLISKLYSHPKVYYTGIVDGGNRGFL